LHGCTEHWRSASGKEGGLKIQEEDQIQIRVTGDSNLPALVYLPGLHGDWTLVGGFKLALAGRLRFVEITYPRTLTWSLHEYAGSVEAALEKAGITEGWLLGESFSSQVVWALMERRKFHPTGVVLAGGFVRHPSRWAVRVAQWAGGTVPLRLIILVLFGYAKLARFRFRKSPEVAKGIQEFIDRRTELDRRAAVHRLNLIFQNNACDVARKAVVPIYAISGYFDPVVPWVLVRRWLRKNCPTFRDYKIVAGADHNVLGTAPATAADHIVDWIEQTR
jgi:pimeloyl-ACP methyl ester carboxylesterase